MRMSRALPLWALIAAAPAGAVNLSATGAGQALIYPYYTVNNSQDTYFTVVNDSYAGTVVKVRFNEGRRGRPVLDLDVFLSPHDTWTATISQTSDDGGAKIVTHDQSCTRPAVPAEGLAFTSSGYDGSNPDIPADDGPHDIERTREGFAEVIAGGSYFAADGSPEGAPPVDCGTIFDDIVGQLVTPLEIQGSAAIVDVGAGHFYSYNATALGAFTSRPLYDDTWGPLQPSLASANSSPVAEDEGATAHFFATYSTRSETSTLYTADFTHGIDAVTAVLMADSISNDFFVDPALGANTDWVVTFPTRRFYADTIYPPYFGGGIDTGVNPGAGLFTFYEAAFYDRESGRALPEDAEWTVLDYDTSVISFMPASDASTPSGVFSSRLATNYSPTSTAGLMRLDVGGHRESASGDGYYPMFPLEDGSASYGVPVVGFMAYNIVNAAAQPGRLANYGATFPHHLTQCVGSAGPNPFVCVH